LGFYRSQGKYGVADLNGNRLTAARATSQHTDALTRQKTQLAKPCQQAWLDRRTRWCPHIHHRGRGLRLELLQTYFIHIFRF
jgi:hypothetical protein